MNTVNEEKIRDTRSWTTPSLPRSKVVQDHLTGVIWIGQPSYTEKLLGMYDSNL